MRKEERSQKHYKDIRHYKQNPKTLDNHYRLSFLRNTAAKIPKNILAHQIQQYPIMTVDNDLVGFNFKKK